jgi:hypothetical protein
MIFSISQIEPGRNKKGRLWKFGLPKAVLICPVATGLRRGLALPWLPGCRPVGGVSGRLPQTSFPSFIAMFSGNQGENTREKSGQAFTGRKSRFSRDFERIFIREPVRFSAKSRGFWKAIPQKAARAILVRIPESAITGFVFSDHGCVRPS